LLWGVPKSLSSEKAARPGLLIGDMVTATRRPDAQRPRERSSRSRCRYLAHTHAHADGTFEPLQTLVAVKLRPDCMSVLVGVAVKPMSELR
jgi:hypothetical protein